MNAEDGAVVGLCVAFLGVAIAGGPAGIVDLTPEPGAIPGNGTVTVERVEFNDTVVQLRRDGDGDYYVEDPEVYVDVADVGGNPVLSYKARSDSLRYLTGELTFPKESTDRFIVGGQPSSVPDWAPTNASYEGEVVVTLRLQNGSRQILREQITIVTDGVGNDSTGPRDGR